MAACVLRRVPRQAIPPRGMFKNMLTFAVFAIRFLCSEQAYHGNSCRPTRGCRAIQEAVMRDKRKLKRRNLIYYLHVLDRASGGLIGYLVDISTAGVLIMTENPIELGTQLELKILLESELSVKQYLYFDARAVRCEKSINGTNYDIGCQLLNLASEDFREIEAIIDELGFRD
jgi:hypothetical protein